tara:strand:- start:568 stop:1596 length:1029 start_codon:yes stop_codon:yes gene_type:complete
MKKKVVVIGHADADGHVIAQQTRLNLELVPSFDVHVVVDENRTRGHQSWKTVDQLIEADDADIVVFVDMMFSPTTFAEEADSLVEWAHQRSQTKVFIIDHHPLPISRLNTASNVRCLYRPNVFECTIGPKSGLMVLAALDENQEKLVASAVEPHHKKIALGLKRAAAPGGHLAGPLLMALVENKRWDLIYLLGEDAKEFHRLVRGRRPKDSPKSDLFLAVNAAAEQLAQESVNATRGLINDSRSDLMAYDLASEGYESTPEGPKRINRKPVPKRDLEAIVTLLELAAISLTDTPDDTFSLEDLVREAKLLAGTSFELEMEDIINVMSKAAFVKSVGKQLQLS